MVVVIVDAPFVCFDMRRAGRGDKIGAECDGRESEIRLESGRGEICGWRLRGEKRFV